MSHPTRDHILDAAAKVFAEHGFRGATTRLIAEAADVNEVTLFRLFGSKDVLLGEAIRTRVYEREVSPLPETPGDARAELIAWAAAEYKQIVAHRASIRQGMSELNERPELRRCMAQGPLGGYARLQRYINALMAAGRCAGDADAVNAAAMLLGALFADAMGRDMMPEVLPPAKHVPHAYVDLMLAGIGYSARPAAVRRRSASARAKRSA
ncbi:MAG: TetR/AcrR family transcriptional regulator [Gemmatimonadetes bacterium]|nr:TetR/AcrR family transcriptional regulator [Gemmatimonadota bacterium]